MNLIKLQLLLIIIYNYNYNYNTIRISYCARCVVTFFFWWPTPYIISWSSITKLNFLLCIIFIRRFLVIVILIIIIILSNHVEKWFYAFNEGVHIGYFFPSLFKGTSTPWCIWLHLCHSCTASKCLPHLCFISFSKFNVERPTYGSFDYWCRGK